MNRLHENPSPKQNKRKKEFKAIIGCDCPIPYTHLLILCFKQDSHLQLNHAVEIIGKVQNDLSVRVMASTDLGPEGGIGKFCSSLLED